MNIVQKLLVKALLPSVRNTDFFKGMYQYVGNNAPQWIDQNNEAYINQGFARNADVFSIVNYIIKRASTIPWKVYKMAEDGKLTEIKNHPLIDLMENPNPMMGQAFFIQALLAYKMILGNSYIWMPRLQNGMNRGQTKELWVMPANKIEIVSNGFAKPIDHYSFTGTTTPQFKPEDVIHLKYVNLDDSNGSSLYGMSPLRAGAMTLTQSNEGYTSNVKAFQNMGAVGILSEESKDNTQMSTEQASYIQTWWQQRFGGSENRGKIHITSRNLKWINLGLSPVDMNILESLKLSFRQLCNLYQFPSQLLNDNEHATYNNIREAKKALYQDVIIPELHSLRDELNRALVPAYGDNLWLDIDTSGIDVLQDDKKALAEWLNLCPYITNQDKQRMMGVTEDPEYPKYTIPSGLIPLDALPGVNEEEELEKAISELTKRGVNDYK